MLPINKLPVSSGTCERIIVCRARSAKRAPILKCGKPAVVAYHYQDGKRFLICLEHDIDVGVELRAVLGTKAADKLLWHCQA